MSHLSFMDTHCSIAIKTYVTTGKGLISKYTNSSCSSIPEEDSNQKVGRRPKLEYSVQFSSVFSHVRLFVTPWIIARQASLSITNSQNPPKLMSIKSVMPSNHLILCQPLLLLPSIFPSIRVFSNESTFRIRWTKYWSFSFNISTSNEHPGLISFRMNWLDLLTVQRTLKSLLQPQFKSVNSSALSFLYSPTLTSIHDHGKNHGLTRQTLHWQSNVSAFEYAI